jgi:alpha-ketoglutarate-dependent 2,4-dichlorophenoxyacetate dioxygenase
MVAPRLRLECKFAHHFPAEKYRMSTAHVVRNLHPKFGAELGGIKITGPATVAERGAVLDAAYRYGVVLLRDQLPSQTELGEFARSLGPIWTLKASMMQDSATIKVATDAVYHYTNRDKDGKPLSADDPAMTILKNNEAWHTDSTYSRPRPCISIFMGRVVPEQGADTQFCDTRVAYESLEPPLQDKLRTINAYHSVVHGLSRIGRGDKIKGDDRERYSGTKRPLVEYHVPSRRYALVMPHYIYRMDGMSDEDCEKLRVDLVQRATKPELIYSHQWRVGDTLLWDNRCTMHRATPFDSDKYLRDETLETPT